jgi:cellulose synthase operon protein C
MLTASFAVVMTIASAQNVVLPDQSATVFQPAAPFAAPDQTVTGQTPVPSVATAPQWQQAAMPVQPVVPAPPPPTSFQVLQWQPAPLPVEAVPHAAPAIPVPILPQATVAPLPMPSALRAPAAAPVIPGENPFVPRSTAVLPGQPAQVQADAGLQPAPAAAPWQTAALSVPATEETIAPAAPRPFVLDLKEGTASAGEAQQTPANVEGPDEGALRYYASQRDLKRVGAEIRRLKSRFPGWEVPADLFSPTGRVNEQPLWDLYAVGNYAAVRQMIDRLRGDNANWTPSADLTTKLARAEARQEMDRAYRQKNWFQVLLLAQNTPDILVCEEMNALWMVAEALAASRENGSSFELYKYILTRCPNQQERLATMQKAKLVLPEEGTASLLGLGRVMPDGTLEFEDVGFDGLRERMGRVAQGDAPLAAPAADELARFAEFVQRRPTAADAALFGWYCYGLEEWQAAQAWFAFAQQIAPDPKMIEGIVLTTRNLGDYERAMEIAMKHRDRSPELTKVFIELGAASLTSDDIAFTFTSEEQDIFEKAVEKRRSALGAQAAGWLYVTRNDLDTARKWFTRSVDWEVTEGGVVGLAVIASRRKQNDVLASLKSQYGGRYDGLSDFTVYRSKSVAKRSVSSAGNRTASAKRSTRQREEEEVQGFRKFLARVLNPAKSPS